MNLLIPLLVCSLLATSHGVSPPICPPALGEYLREEAEAEVSTIEEVAVSIGHIGRGSISASTPEALYEDILAILGDKTDTPDNRANFFAAFEEIVEMFLASCYGPTPVSEHVFPYLRAKFEKASEDKDIATMRETYAEILCISKTAPVKKRQLSPITLFYNSISALDFGLIFGIGFDYTIAFTIDDTGSMSSEIEDVKCLVRSFIKSERNVPAQYILATFNDPELAASIFTPNVYDSHSVSDMSNFLTDLDAITANGGGDLPEYGMGGILRTTNTITTTGTGINHNILFTDAVAKDYTLGPNVEAVLFTKETVLHAFMPSWQIYPPGAYPCTPLDTACIQNYAYMHAVDSTGLGVAVELNSPTSFNEFVNAFLGMTGTVLQYNNCGSSPGKRSTLPSGCQDVEITEYATKLIVIAVVPPSGSGSITIINPRGATLASETISSDKLYSYEEPLQGTWKVCVTGSVTADIKVTNKFPFEIQFSYPDKYGAEKLAYGTVPTPDCNSKFYIFSDGVSGLSSTGNYLNVLVNGTINQQIPLSRVYCKAPFEGYMRVPNGTFQLQFVGNTAGGVTFTADKLRNYNPSEFTVQLLPLSIPTNLAVGSAVNNFIFTLKVKSLFDRCPFNGHIAVETDNSDVTVVVSPSVVMGLLESSSLTVQVNAAISSSATPGDFIITVKIFSASGSLLLEKHYPSSIAGKSCPCQNGGTCTYITAFGREYVKCKCPPGYYGIRCDYTG